MIPDLWDTPSIVDYYWVTVYLILMPHQANFRYCGGLTEYAGMSVIYNTIWNWNTAGQQGIPTSLVVSNHSHDKSENIQTNIKAVSSEKTHL